MDDFGIWIGLNLLWMERNGMDAIWIGRLFVRIFKPCWSGRRFISQDTRNWESRAPDHCSERMDGWILSGWTTFRLERGVLSDYLSWTHPLFNFLGFSY